MAEPSSSKSDSGPSDSVTRLVIAFIVPRAVRADFEVRDVPHVERMVRVRIGVARRTRIEVAACRGKVGLALADRMQVHAVHAGLQPRNGQRDLDDFPRALLALDERRPPR